MKRGFTLIELLVVMVIIALLVGILLPALGRAREEARKTQCRSNLRQVGLAMQMYTNDNRGWTPASYGFWVYADGATPTKATTGFGVTNYGQNGAAEFLTSLIMRPKLNHYNNRWTGATDTDMSNLDVSHVFSWDDNFLSAAPRFRAPGGGQATGLGLLLSGGYLTQQGGVVLGCPSLTYDVMGGQYYQSLWSSATYAKAGVRYRKETLTFDPEEPFYTTGGRATWSNGNLLNEIGLPGPINWPAVYDISLSSGFWPLDAGVSLWGSSDGIAGRQITEPEGDSSRGCTGKGSWQGWGYNYRVPSAYCTLVGSYATRMAVDADISYGGWDFTWNSFDMDDSENQGIAIASDGVHGFYHRPDLWTYDPGTGWVWPDFNQPGRQDRRDWFSNHDMSYNVLFTDGSVKTFSDAGLSLYKEVLLMSIAWPRMMPSGIKGAVVNRYFDAIYTQD